jgi:hypothetical protein
MLFITSVNTGIMGLLLKNKNDEWLEDQIGPELL